MMMRLLIVTAAYDGKRLKNRKLTIHSHSYSYLKKIMNKCLSVILLIKIYNSFHIPFFEKNYAKLNYHTISPSFFYML